MKDIKDVAFIVQARLNSQRVSQKMLEPFAGTTLFDLVLDKLITSSIIPKKQIIASVYEEELKNIASKKGIDIYNRSEESANEDKDLKTIYEWHDKLDYKYVILISGCIPFLTIKTIDEFVSKFLTQDEENLFAVIEKKQYYWDAYGKMINSWPAGETIMNTKVINPTYEAAHCLYASKLNIIKNNHFMVDYSKENLILYTIEEHQAFDIDYKWQFKIAELLYGKI